MGISLLLVSFTPDNYIHGLAHQYRVNTGGPVSRQHTLQLLSMK